jgi:ABC-type dipeptide/oligopeptide/nickel transport system permease component
MLPFLLRRLLWALPTLLLVSLASFLFLSFVPDPTDDPEVRASLSIDQLDAMRRERFVDLPRFLNLSPLDARRRSLDALSMVAAGGVDAERGAAELVRIGAAALPHVVPALDGFEPETRQRVALALAPIAERMHLPNRADASRADSAALYWARVWANRSVDFTPSGVRTAVERLSRYRTESRGEEVEELDTYALEALVARLPQPEDAADVEVARALVEVLAHATGRDDRVPPGASVAQARAVVERWRAYWFVYGTDYRTLDGAGRASALVLETRYGKWAYAVVTSFGADGQAPPALLRVLGGAPTTFVIVFGAIAIAYSLGVALGVLSALQRGRKADVAIAVTVLAANAVPTAVVAVALRSTHASTSLLWATLVVAAGLVAAPTRHQRSALTTTLSSDFVRAAVARGAGPFRTVVFHGLRNSLIPVVTLATLEPPMALGATFVVEHVFALRGLGAMTVEAVGARDTGFLMALSVLLAAVASLAVVVTDVAHALVDPRSRHKLARGRT